MSPVGSDGKRKLFFSASNGNVASPVDLPCGQCIGCRLERSRDWATRIMHEASLHDRSSFITLTYEDLHLPKCGTLVKKHVQDFLKRFRKIHSCRFFGCGEYGDRNGRPHYHLCIFGWDFPDRVFFKRENGYNLYISPELSKYWTFGNNIVGNLTFESAAYVARYCLKKVTGPSAQAYYERVDPGTGEITAITPEYCHMSLKPGIGARWFERWQSDCYPSDEVIVRGHSCGTPRFYDKLLEKVDPVLYKQVKDRRALDMHLPENQRDSLDLHIAGISKRSQISTLKRSL